MVKKLKEDWVPIENSSGLYEISNHGRVRSLDRYMKHWRGGKSFKKGRVFRLYCNTNGYPHVDICNGKKTTHLIHRLVGKAFVPNPNNYPEINHINGIKTDNRAVNLEWVTRSKNAQHAYNIGLMASAKGEKNGQSKLTEKQVIEIKKKLLRGCRNVDLAREYGVSRHAVSMIKSGRSWRHLEAA